MRHQPRDAAVAVEKRVNPKQAMMGGGGRKDCVRLAEPRIASLELGQKARNRAGANRNMLPDPNVARAQFARNYAGALMAARVFDPEQLIGGKLAKELMN